MKEIQDEIKHYRPGKRLADAMIALGEAGFYFSGHGYCLGDGGEDFSFCYDYKGRDGKSYIYIALSNSACYVDSNDPESDEDGFGLDEDTNRSYRTIGKAVKAAIALSLELAVKYKKPVKKAKKKFLKKK